MLYIGTSGWQYRDWRGRFYPDGLPTPDWLASYATRFPVVEVNSTFYNLPAPSTVERWADQTAPDFRFAVKLSRYLTHIRRLRDPAEPVSRFFERLRGLGPKLGPVLLQLPPTLKADVGLLDEALSVMPARARVAVEVRHPSWFNADVRDVLTNHGAALCAADRRGRVQGPLWTSADWGYVRLHEGTARPKPCYGDAALDHWLRRIVDGWGQQDVFVFFNNDQLGCAPANAARLAQLARKAGLPIAEPTY